MLFIGDDWAEAHHDIEIEDGAGRVLARRRLPEGLAGITTLHELVAEHLDPAAEPDQVRWASRPTVGRGCRPCWRPAMGCSRSTRCRWPVIGNAIPRQGRSRIRRMRICWPRSSGWIGASPPDRRRQPDRRTGQDRGSGTSDDDLVAGAAGEHTASLLREYYPAALAALGTDLAGRDALAVLTVAPNPTWAAC